MNTAKYAEFSGPRGWNGRRWFAVRHKIYRDTLSYVEEIFKQKLHLAHSSGKFVILLMFRRTADIEYLFQFRNILECDVRIPINPCRT